MTDIAPGTKINVKVVKQPTSASATKTIVRLLSKDPSVVAENKRHAKIRKKAQTMSPRGGRWRVWESRLAKQHPVKAQLGDEGTIVASYDVMKDLPSVSRFLDITAVN